MCYTHVSSSKGVHVPEASTGVLAASRGSCGAWDSSSIVGPWRLARRTAASRFPGGEGEGGSWEGGSRCPWGKFWPWVCLHFGVDEHPCATYFDVHQGYRVLTHIHGSNKIC